MATTQSKYGRRFDEEFKREVAALASKFGVKQEQVARDLGKIAGIHYTSAKHPAGTNLVVFVDRMTAAPSDFLEVHDPEGHLTQRLGS